MKKSIEEKREDHRLYMGLYRKRNPKKAQIACRAWRERNKEKFRAGIRRWIELNREKRRTHVAVDHAIARGMLSKQTICSRCGEISQLDAHHEDYSKPFEIIWFCRTCHKKHHAGVQVDERV